MSDVDRVLLQVSELYAASLTLKGSATNHDASKRALAAVREHAKSIMATVDGMNSSSREPKGTSGAKKQKEVKAEQGGDSLLAARTVEVIPQKQARAGTVPAESSVADKRKVEVSSGKEPQPKKPKEDHALKQSTDKEHDAPREVPATHVPDHTIEGYLTGSRFADLSILPATKRALAEVLRYDRMTAVQDQSIPPAMRGLDALVKAKTGTGKTLGFLIPAINNLVLELSKPARAGAGAVRPMVLVISPTRELTLQIAAEAGKLCSFHPLRVVTLVGGTNINEDKRALLKAGKSPEILVATPGRLIDHIENDAQVRALCAGVLVLVLDEADRLLDMGFKRDIDKVLSIIAAQKRQVAPPLPWTTQTLLFSATVGEDIKQIARASLRPGYSFIDTVGDDEDQTHSHVPQFMLSAPLEQQVSVLARILEEKMREPAFKIIVFFVTARQTELMAALFSAAGVNVLEMHSRKSQSARIRTAETFRTSVDVAMFSSDVSARGMDYPNITFVLQVGLTDKASYIHRLGRTARAGKSGSGCLLVTPFEDRVMRQALGSDINLLPMPADGLSSGGASKLSARVEAIIGGIASGANRELEDCAKVAWIAWLGFYNSNMKRLSWGRTELVGNAVVFARSLGIRELPAIQKKTLGKMNLKGCPGLRVE